MKYIIGIDEAGRGPLAGPVTVSAFGADKKMEKWLLQNIFNNRLRDSKKLSPEKREEIYKKFCLLKKDPTSLPSSYKATTDQRKLRGAGKIYFSVTHISNKIIDKIGISKAIYLGIKKSLNKLEHINLNYNDGHCNLKLDGLLKAPEKFKNQKTIIKGDEKEVCIACASIVAKVSRDRLMCRLAKKYSKYSFEIHKGYGTKLHYKLIQKYGISEIHRKSFCKSILNQ